MSEKEKPRVGDVYDSDIVQYKIVKETRCKYLVERTNKSKHPCAPGKKWYFYIWKNSFFTDKLDKLIVPESDDGGK